jgi:hypothetical protein
MRSEQDPTRRPHAIVPGGTSAERLSAVLGPPRIYAALVSRRLLLLTAALAAAGCASNDKSANITCSWSQGAGDAHIDEAAHICAHDDGRVEAFHFQPGSRVTLQLQAGPKALTVGEDGRARTRVSDRPGIVAVTGTQANGQPFSNGLTLLPQGE